MREHEVPTHVQAEDRVLLWFTFPQIVAVTAVCALSYGAYHYAPVGSTGVRVALAVVLGLAGIAMIVGKIGGRGLPLVAADLLKYRLGARRYVGPPSQLARSEPPAPAQSGPDPLRLLARRAGRGIRRLRRSREHRNGRMPLRHRGWLGRWKGRRGAGSTKSNAGNQRAGTLEARRRKTRKGWLAAVAVLAVAGLAVPQQAALAWGPWDEAGWRLDEIEYEPPEPVSGRRLFVEGLRIAGGRAEVTLRAAADVELRVRAFGGLGGRELRFWGAASLVEGERIDYSLPLIGDAPSLTFSWADTLGQSGAVTLKGGQLPYPLPAVEGELCDLRVTSLGWTPDSVTGVVASECVDRIDHVVSLQTVAGHRSVTERTVLEAQVTGVTGTVSVSGGGSQAGAPFVTGGETWFRLPVAGGEAVHTVTIGADLTAALRVPIPPLTRLTHRAARTEVHSRRVSMSCGEGGSVSRTVRISVHHPERVEAETVQRAPITRSRSGTMVLALSVGSDAPFETLVVPPPAPEPEPAWQTPAGDGELRSLFDLLGWRWPW